MKKKTPYIAYTNIAYQNTTWSQRVRVRVYCICIDKYNTVKNLLYLGEIDGADWHPLTDIFRRGPAAQVVLSHHTPQPLPVGKSSHHFL